MITNLIGAEVVTRRHFDDPDHYSRHVPSGTSGVVRGVYVSSKTDTLQLIVEHSGGDLSRMSIALVTVKQPKAVKS